MPAIQKGSDLTGVAGYLPERAAKSLKRAKTGTADLQFEPGSDKVVFRVNLSDIEKVIPGSSKGGNTFVQVILKPGSRVETQLKMVRDIKNLEDASLFRLTAAAVSTVSSVSGEG